MNEGQQKFYGFIMANIMEDKKEIAEEMLQEGFKKQDDGTFAPAYMQSFMTRMLPMIKPENVEIVKQAMMSHKQN